MSHPGTTVAGMTTTSQVRIGQLLDYFVPKGDNSSPQREFRMVLNVLLQTMCAKRSTKPGKPTSIRECRRLRYRYEAATRTAFSISTPACCTLTC